MKHGDISNQSAPVIAFQIDCILVPRKKTLLDKVKNALLGEVLMLEIQEPYRVLMDKIFRFTDMSVAIVMKESDENEMQLNKLNSADIPYSEVFYYNNYFELTLLMRRGVIALYVDDSIERRSLVNDSHAVSLAKANNLISRW